MEQITHAFGQFTHAVAVAFYIFLSIICSLSLLIGHLVTKWYYKWKIGRAAKKLAQTTKDPNAKPKS